MTPGLPTGKQVLGTLLAVALSGLLLADCGGGGSGSSAPGSSGSGSSGTGGSGSGGSLAGTSALQVHVSGGHLVDANGKVLQLRGVNISGMEFWSMQGSTDPWGGAPPNWSLVTSWGANAVRIPLNEDSWLAGSAGSGLATCETVDGTTTSGTQNPDPGANYVATLDSAIAAATAAGLYVILDLHISAPGVYCANYQDPMADADHSLLFWTQVATRYQNYQNVIFEAFNEPWLSQINAQDVLTPSNAWTVLISGGTDSYFEDLGGNTVPGTWNVAGMNSIISTIRATGAQNVILTSTLFFASAVDRWMTYMPTDPLHQLGAVWHAYPDPPQLGSTLPGCANDNGTSCDATVEPAAAAIVSAGYPVVITEYGDYFSGTPGAAASPFVSSLLPYADTAGISYLAWCFNEGIAPDTGFTSGNGGFYLLDTSGNPTNGYGTYVQQHYQCVAALAAGAPNNCP